jgi:TonB family protein
MQARAKAGLKPHDPGPLPDPIRKDLAALYRPTIDEGIANLRHALQIDPQYDDAMAYLNLLKREGADLLDNAEDYRRDIREADEWVQKALETKKAKAASNPNFVDAAPPATPQRIRVSASDHEKHLVKKIDPVYPPLARQARIAGTVKFTVIVGRDGSVLNLQLISGHPLLVQSAVEAVKQWQYSPTLLNGNPVEVVTQVSVVFALSD